ncbi:4'-phosphopantetheinyl transferase family protein [Acuticoccus mangrovi]|uniref:4'-phosphopantetheinyl transferase superfamily protein n=1 Tax=Acuticoccus mangrovi TaxID=2796142 RepID=A0A934MJ53_9HYPH|nr:4'-phosphopantetheinyl transferase superfamily protein [Acuticoccus mangrovi]MBJ3778555.1 4'-phosphopantetheinyl transferase superfamily protein [Acuticoccus mangrovi]
MSASLSDLPLRTLYRPRDTIGPHAAAWALEGGADQPVILHSLFGGGTVTEPGAPTLWFGVPADGALSSLLSVLPEADRLHIRRLRSEKDRWSVAAARAALRILLSQRLDCSAQDIFLIRDERGKPSLDPQRHGAMAGELHISISHARELVAVAIGRSRIGIDVEAVRGFPDLMDVADMQFAREMRDDLRTVETDRERVALFFRFWTLGEAFIKATGEGIAQGLQSFAFSAHGRPALTRVDEPWGPCDRWSFGTLGWGEAPKGLR